jgi:hypothetical protein
VARSVARGIGAGLDAVACAGTASPMMAPAVTTAAKVRFTG